MRWFNCLVNDVKTLHCNFQEVARVLQSDEQHIARNGAVSEEMARYINKLIKVNENKDMWIGTLMNEGIPNSDSGSSREIPKLAPNYKIGKMIKNAHSGQNNC